MRCWRHGGPRAAASSARRPASYRPSGSGRRRLSPPPDPASSWQSWGAPPPPASPPLARAAATRSARTPPAPRPPSRQARQRQRVSEAAAFCADSLSGSWQEAVADRVTGYAGSAWERLRRSHRKRNCKALARLARSILEAKTRLHDLAGEAAGWGVKKMGAGGAAQAFARELASNIPLPTDAKMIAVARGVQIAGILLCVIDGRDLTKCECFTDLALAESKEQVQRILTAAMSDWTGLAQFTPSTPAPDSRSPS